MTKSVVRYINISVIVLTLIICTFILNTAVLSILLLFAFFLELYLLIRAKKDESNLNMVHKNLLNFNKSESYQQILIKYNSEIGDLTLEINNLLERFETLKVNSQNNETSRKQLLSNLSHDIRTPLTSIVGYVDALKDGIVSNEDECKEFYDILSMKTKNLKSLTDQIFNVAKIDSDDLELNFEYIELNEFLKSLIIDFLPSLEKYNIEFVNEIGEDKIVIYSDRIALTRIFENIIKNAIQHGKSGMILGISTSSFDKNCRVVVWDKGKGIPKDKQQYIFERLFKVDDSRQMNASSSGLGMSIAKKLVLKLNGEINLKSKENELTEFIVELPILKELKI